MRSRYLDGGPELFGGTLDTSQSACFPCLACFWLFLPTMWTRLTLHTISHVPNPTIRALLPAPSSSPTSDPHESRHLATAIKTSWSFLLPAFSPYIYHLHNVLCRQPHPQSHTRTHVENSSEWYINCHNNDGTHTRPYSAHILIHTLAHTLANIGEQEFLCFELPVIFLGIPVILIAAGCSTEVRLTALVSGLHSSSFCKILASICFCDDFPVSWVVTFNGAYVLPCY